jgi:hypothetical protein
MTKKFAEKVLQYLGLKIANRMANDLEIAKFYALNDMISSGEILNNLDQKAMTLQTEDSRKLQIVCC